MSLVHVLESLLLVDLVQVFHEVGSQLPLLNDLLSQVSGVAHREDELSVVDPLIVPVLHHDSVEHVPHSLELLRLAVG